jgi:hypothetical protein
VLLTAEEQHFVLGQRPVDQGRGFSIEFTESHSLDSRTDVLAQLHHTEITAHDRPFPSFIV